MKTVVAALIKKDGKYISGVSKITSTPVQVIELSSCSNNKIFEFYLFLLNIRKKIQKLLTYFEDNPVLIAYDVSIFKIYPNHKDDIEWQDMLKSFEFGTIKTAKTILKISIR